jgi:hypothetical protein
MKALKCFLVLFSFVGLMLVGCSDQSQSPISPDDQLSLDKKEIHYFTIKDFPVPPPYPYVIDPGVKQHLPNGDIHYKKVGVFEFTEARDLDGNIDPLVTGLIENYLSTMIDGETGSGPANGKTLSANLPGQEVEGFWETNWEGYRSYVGKKYFDLPIGSGEYHYWALPLKMVGHGKGGLIDKMQMKVEATIIIFSDDTNFPEPIFWSGSGSGFYK